MQDAILGTRIRQRRREVGKTQSALARTVGISPSYLNLIEWNKRPIGGKLLLNIAQALDLPLSALDSSAEKRLSTTLSELARQPDLQGFGIEVDRTSELIGRFPGWAKGMAALARSERDAVERAHTLSDRMSNDPFLGEQIHVMLSRIAAIRSASEILTEYDVPTENRGRFNNIINDESRILSDVAEALALYLDKAEEEERVLTPVDEVEALFDASGAHFPEIEQTAEALSGRLTDPLPMSRRSRARILAADHMKGAIDKIIASSSVLESDAGRTRARQALMDYAVAAILMPMQVFATRAADLRYDIEGLSETLSAEVEVVCHRLTALPKEEEHPTFGYLRANAAGTIIEMIGLEQLTVPRYASACPLWVLFRAQQSPETVIRQRVLFPNGARFVFVGRARHLGAVGFGKPRHYVTDMVAMLESDAAKTIYEPEASTPVEEVGPSCRLCPRAGCPHRVDDPFAA